MLHLFALKKNCVIFIENYKALPSIYDLLLKLYSLGTQGRGHQRLKSIKESELTTSPKVGGTRHWHKFVHLGISRTYSHMRIQEGKCHRANRWAPLA